MHRSFCCGRGLVAGVRLGGSGDGQYYREPEARAGNKHADRRQDSRRQSGRGWHLQRRVVSSFVRGNERLRDRHRPCAGRRARWSSARRAAARRPTASRLCRPARPTTPGLCGSTSRLCWPARPTTSGLCGSTSRLCRSAALSLPVSGSLLWWPVLLRLRSLLAALVAASKQNAGRRAGTSPSALLPAEMH
jgi:hypothetical protein